MTGISYILAVITIKLSWTVTGAAIDTINTCGIVFTGVNHTIINVDITVMSSKACRTVACEVIKLVNTSAIV